MGARAATRLEAALTVLGIDHDIKVYPAPPMDSSTTTTPPTQPCC
jgi:hypothetical protein